MKLKLENVGKIKKANIELNGITIIAGENSTGKSTVGKVLFCIFDSFFKIKEQINNEREKSIIRVLSNYSHEFAKHPISKAGIRRFARKIVEGYTLSTNNKKQLLDELEDFYLLEYNLLRENSMQASLEVLANKIFAYLAIEDKDIITLILQKRLEAEFGMKVGYLNTPDEETNICLEIKNNKIEFKIKNNKNLIINQYISLIKEIIYIDDPFVLDNLEINFPFYISSGFEHRSQLLDKIAKSDRNSDFSVLDEFVVNEKLENIFHTMVGICDGELVLDNERSMYVYKTDKLNDNLGMSNLSTGMKNFLILRTLLKNGSIDENGIIILDEPEIHLHPEWQLKFAEIIVQIQKEFNMNILLNTHSPYFLNAIQVYSDKYQITDKCKYYLTEEQNRRVFIVDVTENIERIYEKLARPLQELENLEYSDERANQ